MQQLLQYLDSGATRVVTVPAPCPRPLRILVRATHSLVSVGTERMLVEFGRASWWRKLRMQPERTRMLWQKIKAEGFWSTWNAVRNKLAQPLPLGYCHVGRVLDAGGVAGFNVGDRVVSNGPHAEVILTQPALCVVIPEGVSDEAATFTPLAAVALQGIRLMKVGEGDAVVVMGLGLIGQLAVQILRAQGCEVLGLDPDANKCALATRWGAKTLVNRSNQTVESEILAWTKGRGATGVLITASTSSDDLVNLAARSCQRHGRVVLVGVTGLKLNRADFYAKEVSFQVSNSYGARELGGDFSATENFRQVLAWMESGKINHLPLITQRYAFAQAAQAYRKLSAPETLGLVLQYEVESEATATSVKMTVQPLAPHQLGVSVVGAGNFASRTLLPALVKQGRSVALRSVVSEQGLQAWVLADRHHASEASTDFNQVLKDKATSAVLLATQHHLHADMAIAALEAGKSVWVEKPLALTEADLKRVHRAALASTGVLCVGFNRRFSPLAFKAKASLQQYSGPKHITYTINAGALPADHWTLDPQRGGGRIVGECCHFIDFCRFLVGQPCVKADTLARPQDGQDGGRFLLTYADGSTAQINYLTDTAASLPKEVIKVEVPGYHFTIWNWRTLTTYRESWRQRSAWYLSPAKGHTEAVAAFLKAVRQGGPTPISLEELVETSRWAIHLQASR